MEIKKLLYISELEPPGREVLRQLLGLGKLGLEEIICLIPRSSKGLGGSLGDQEIAIREIRDKDLSVDRILATAHGERAVMIAACLRRRPEGGIGSSLGKKLIKSTNVPLVLLPAREDQAIPAGKEIFSKVLFATKWEPVAERALGFLLECRELIGELEIVTVINRKLSIRDMIQLKKLLEETRGAFLDKGIDAEAHIYAGKPSDEILLASRDYRANAIVMGATKTKGLRSLIYKGCTREVAGKSDLPTFLIP
ncbi:MAG: universal stress protein [Deltaproteobacteria bacterium]|nr:universal stress protein [Deltaproteobacteria bacterium]MBW2137061.1 universal stress protein [Deltaproteobacteria bacterium]